MAARHPVLRTTDPNVAEIASLIGDAARAAMLFALLDGIELPASELAFRAGVSAQAASAHLAKLCASGLIAVRSSGRQRFFSIASPDVAHAMEALAVIARPAPVVALTQSTTMQHLREARSCYDHLAGRLGVALTDYFINRNALVQVDNDFEVGRRGEMIFRALGIDVAGARESRRRFARVCLDWTQRRPHLAGSLGAALLAFLVSEGWLARNRQNRALRLTPRGRIEFKKRFDIDPD